jgi:hypothetical protein
MAATPQELESKLDTLEEFVKRKDYGNQGNNILSQTIIERITDTRDGVERVKQPHFYEGAEGKAELEAALQLLVDTFVIKHRESFPENDRMYDLAVSYLRDICEKENKPELADAKIANLLFRVTPLENAGSNIDHRSYMIHPASSVRTR